MLRFITEFGKIISENYDIIGHIHTKKTIDIKDSLQIKQWYCFLLENLIGGKKPMIDVILGKMACDETIENGLP